MTSSLRRNRQTTPRNIRPETDRKGNCGFAILAVALAWILATDSAAAELQWRRGGLPIRERASTASHNPEATSGSIRVVTYVDEDGAPVIMPTDYTGRASVRSVVTHREHVRTAQLPNFDDQSSEEATEEPDILSPFGELPPPDDLDFEEPEQEEAEREYNLPSGPLPEGPDAVGPPSQAPSQPIPQPPAQRRTLPTQPRPERDFSGTGIDRALLDNERIKAQGVCEDEAGKLRSSTLHDVDLTIVVSGTEGEDYPFECSIDHGQVYSGRCWPQITYLWKASALCHKPLFFEDVQLERYGHTWGPYSQPFISGAHFFSRLPILPYCMGITPPNECQYALGYYRPGNCAPYQIEPIPYTHRAALFQAGAVYGAAAAIP